MKRIENLAMFMAMIMIVGILVGMVPTVIADTEPNDTFAAAEVLPEDTPVTGSMIDPDADDYYKFTVVEGQKIAATLEAKDGPDSVYGYLYTPNQDNIGSTDYLNPGVSETLEWTSNQAVTGDYYYRVSGGDCNYTLTLEITDQDDAGSGTDAGDSNTDAHPVTPDTYSGWIADGDEADYYQFEVVNAQIITVSMSVGTTDDDDLYYYVYDPQKDTIITSDYIAPGTEETNEYTTSNDTAGTYYLRVEGGDNDYEFDITLTDQDDAGQGMDASDDLTSPTMVDMDVEHEGWVCDVDEADVYGFQVVDGQKLSLTLKTGTDRDDTLYAYVYGPDKDTVASTDYLEPDISETVEWTTSYATAGLYYVKIEGGDNNYFFTFSVEDQDDGGLGVDAPDALNEALPVLDSTGYTGWLADADDFDIYAVELENGQILNFTLTTGTTTEDNLYGTMYDPSKESVASTDYLNPDISETLSWTSSNETPGMYYIKVEGGENSYSFDIEVTDQNDADINMDVPGKLTKSLNLAEGEYKGWVADADETDAYNFSVLAGNVFIVNVTAIGDEGNLILEIFDPQKNPLKYETVAAGTTVSYTLPEASAPATNSLYWMTVKGDELEYKIDLTLPTAPPDTTPPTVTIESPLPNAAFQVAQVTVSGSATDNGNISKVEASLDDATYVPCQGKGAWVCTLNLSQGANTVYIRATDTAGNKGKADIVLNLDGTPPTVTISTLSDGDKVKTKETLLSGTASDNVGLSKVEVKVNDGSWQTALGTGTWALNVTLEKGDNNITVRVTDSAGNTAEETLTVTYKKKDQQDSPGFEVLVFVAAISVAVVALMRRDGLNK